MPPPLRHLASLIIASALVLATIFAVRLLRPGDDAWARLQQGGALRIALDPSFPPFDDTDAQGQPVGFDVELARELGRRLGAPVQFQAIAFDGLIDAILADKADLVLSAFPLDPRLNEDVAYSRPYFEAGLVLVAPALSALTGPDDLVGRRVAVEWGSQGDAWARSHNLTILRRETAADALAAVSAGEADAALVDAVTAALAAPPDLALHPLESDPYVIVTSRRAPVLTKAIDDALAAILSDGTWEKLAADYFPRAPVPPRPAATPAP